jgi:hypothetical protein
MLTPPLYSELDVDDGWQIGSVVAVRTARVLSAISSAGSISISPSEPTLCLSCASFMRLTRTGAGGRQPVPDPVTHRGLWVLSYF